MWLAQPVIDEAHGFNPTDHVKYDRHADVEDELVPSHQRQELYQEDDVVCSRRHP
jgi:hypothetical protein